MADEADFSTSAEPSLQQLATFFADELFDVQRLRRVENAMRNAHAEGATVAHAAKVQAAPSLADQLSNAGEAGYDASRKALGWVLAHMVGHMLGVEVPKDVTFGGKIRPQDSAIGIDIAKTMLAGIVGDGGELVPSDEGAVRVIGMSAHMTLMSWLEGIVIELLAHYIGGKEALEGVTELGHDMVDAMGLSRLIRRAVGPLVATVISTPMDWKVKKQYRPTLLSEALAIRQFTRGAWSREQTNEELARLGYSPDRIDALLSNHYRYLSLDDLMLQVRTGQIDRSFAIAYLQDQGYDETTAVDVINAAETKRVHAVEDNTLGALTRAFVNRDLTEGQFQTLFPPNVYTDIERETFVSAARVERGINIKHLSHGEVIDCIELGILPRAYYRDWLAREGYPDEEAFALELRLAARIDKQTDIDKHRAQLDAERATEKADRLAAALERKAAVDAERELHRRGSLADLNRAVVRGAIPLSRLEEVLAPQYDADTVQILVGLVEDDRLAYVEQQKRADEARQRAGIRHIDVGALEQGVLSDVVTVPEFRQQLRILGFPDADATILTATLQARKADLDAARAARAAADLAARNKSIDLGRAERLVRRGAATLAQYDQLLASLGFAEPSRVAMVELLRLEIDDDVQARALREEAAAKAKVKGLSLEQMRRGVVIGAVTDGAFQSWLITEGYTSDAQLVLLAELRRDVADAEAARAKRAATEAASGHVALPLARVHQAARLGLLSPATYQARLVRDGYTPDDIAIELELLLVEIADVQAARARRDTLAAATASPQRLSLAQLEHAVRAGVAPLDAYRAGAAVIYEPADVELLASTLEAELATLDDARARRVTIAGELTDRTLSLGELEAGVKAGLVTLDAYRAQLVAWGYGSDDADLLAGLLLEQLNAAVTGP